jgi:hypothetical protein
MSKVLAACLMMAAQTYNVPPAVLVGIYNVEGGRVGQQVKNQNGTYDLGPMQINTLWMPELAEYWGVSQPTAKKWVRDDPCTNMGVSAWILRQHLNETKSLSKAIAQYHSRTPHLGSNYRRKVVNAMERQGLLRPGSASAVRQIALAEPGQVTVKATSTDRFGKQAKRSAPKGTVGLQGVKDQARIAAQDSTGGTAQNTQKVGMNSIVVHNPIESMRD